MNNLVKSSVIACTFISTFAVANTTPGSTKYHTQDQRNVSSELHVRYDDTWGDPITIGGKFGNDKNFSVGADYALRDDPIDDEISINGQYNINKNFLVDGAYYFEGESFVFGGDYAQDISFGVFNVGADYALNKGDDELSINGGLLVPFAKTFYYRGDVDYGFEYENFRFKNKVGFFNGNIDANFAYTIQDGDDYFGLEFIYQL